MGSIAEAHETQRNCHFTYSESSDPQSLQQGDVLRKDDGILQILQDVHPHYLKPDYEYFIVLTQSCDLECRKGYDPCKARYITLAAVRPLDLVIEREIDRLQQDPFLRVAGVCKRSSRTTLRDFLVRLHNNNEPRYFFLYEAADYGLPRSVCAFLHLSIAITSRDHYHTCLDSRILSLTEVFRAKLGWMVGNLYARVGTDDWVPRHRSQEDFDREIDVLLDGTCPWKDEKLLQEAKRTAIVNNLWDGKTGEKEKLREVIRQTSVPSKKTILVREVLRVLDELDLVKQVDAKRRIETRLTNDSVFSQYAR